MISYLNSALARSKQNNKERGVCGFVSYITVAAVTIGSAAVGCCSTFAMSNPR